MHMQHKDATPSLENRPIVIKYGGNAMSNSTGVSSDPTLLEIAELWHSGLPLVLVHGGGPEIDAALAQRGIVTERIDGMRVTSSETLEVTEAVLCATINKRIVRALSALGVRAVGISGQEAGTLVARPLKPSPSVDLGYVGEIVTCDPSLLRTLIEAKFLPVVSPIAISTDASSAFNINADLAAASIAGALASRAFIAITDVPRVLRDVNDHTSAIERMTPAEAFAFAEGEACRSGMKPKVRAAALAVENGADASHICGTGTGCISAAMFAGKATIVRH
jgi:acetylglutamate kinase